MARPLRTALGSLAVAALVLAGCNGDDGGDDGIVDDNGVVEGDGGDNGLVEDNGDEVDDDPDPAFDRDVTDDRESGNGAADGIDNDPLEDD